MIMKNVLIGLLILISFSTFAFAQNGSGSAIGEPSPVNQPINESETVVNLDLLPIVNRTANSDIYFNESNHTFHSKLTLKPINMRNLSGVYRPYEEITDLTFDGNNLILSWNGKSVTFEIYTIDEENTKEKLRDKSIEKRSDLNFETHIEKLRGSIYYNHTLVKDKSRQPLKVGYDIVTNNVDCVAIGYELICDEQKISFEEAVVSQGLAVDLTSSNLEISGADLSYIDPTVEIDVLDGAGHWGQIEYSCNQDDYDYGEEDLTGLGSNDNGAQEIRRGFVVFDVDDIDDSAIIDDVVLYLYNRESDIADCSDGDVDLRFYELDEEDLAENPGDDEEDMQEIFEAINSGQDDFYGSLSGVNNDEEDMFIFKRLSQDARSELRTLIDGDPTDEFMIGIKAEPEDEVCDTECNLDIRDSTGFSEELPYIVVSYTIPDNTSPTTGASASSPPGESSYTFGNVANDDVRVTLGCNDGTGSGCKSGFPKYCLDTTNTCSPLTTYSGTIDISMGGISYIRFNSQDKNNNTESVKSRTIVIDKNYTQNVNLAVDNITVWENNGYLVGVDTVSNLTDQLNNALINCVADEEGYCTIPLSISSDTHGSINLSNLNVYFNVTEYSWNVSALPELATYRTRVRATDGLLNSDWDESDSDFAIGNFTFTSPPQIEFVSPTPANGTILNESSFEINLTTSDDGEHYSFVDFNRGLTLWHRFDDVNGLGDPTDISSYNNNGSLQGDAFIDNNGKFGNALHVDGDNDYVSIESGLNGIDFSKEFTIMAWAKLINKSGDSFMGIISKGGNNERNFILSLNSANMRLLSGYEESNGTNHFASGDQIIPLDTWVHLGVRWNGTHVQPFYNGQTDGEGSFESALPSNDDGVAIGRNTFGASSQEWNGSIDEVMVFNRSLSDMEISSIYNSSANQYYNEFTNIPFGNYSFKGYAVDNDGNLNSTEERLISVEVDEAPNIEFISPTPANGSVVNSSEITVNLSTSDVNSHYSFVDFDRDLALWMRFDDLNVSGSPVDLSSYNNNGTLQGDSLIEEGIFGNAVSVDGDGDYVPIEGGLADIDFSKEFTILSWALLRNKSGDDFKGIVSKGTNQERNFILALNGANMRLLSGYEESDGTNHFATGSQILALDEWSHLGVRWNGTHVQPFYNGQPDGEGSPESALPANASGVGIGRNLVGSDSQEWNGSIDEVLIFNRSLSDEEIEAIYDSNANQYEHTFTNLDGGTYTFTGYAVDSNANMNSTERTVTLDMKVKVNETEVVYESGTERVFRFLITNIDGSTLNDVSWSLDTDDGIINSEQNVTLQNLENVFVYAYHNYSAAGNYTVTVTAQSGESQFMEDIFIEV